MTVLRPLLYLVAAACTQAVLAPCLVLGETHQDVAERQTRSFLVETAPSKTQWVTEEEKWELRRMGLNFIDITDSLPFDTKQVEARRNVVFPTHCVQQKAVDALVGFLDKEGMHANLETFSSFYTLLINEADAQEIVRAESFPHPWKQNSIIATIPGQSNRTIVIGAHQDSINLLLPSLLAAPGADDDGSGTVTIMEVFKALLRDQHVSRGNVSNTMEFHWYSAEEGGLLGSQAIFQNYSTSGRDFKAMLQQDMTGYVQGTLDAHRPESVGVIVDFVSAGLTKFIKTVIEEYCDIPWVETKCGYACSDHASASKVGFPSAFVIESAFEDSNRHIHSTDDRVEYLSFDHMLQHARMTLGLVYELGFYDFEDGSTGAPEEL